MVRNPESIPTGLITTGQNTASQELLFSQLAERVQSETDALIVTIRPGDASNLKAALKKLIRDATNTDHDDEDERSAPSVHGVSLQVSSGLSGTKLTGARAINF